MQRYRRFACPGAVIAALLILAGGVAAAEFYVSPDGADTADGSSAAPFATIARGISKLQPGDVLNVKGGIYKESCTVAIKATREKPVVIRAAVAEDSDECAWIQATGRDGILVRESSYVTIEGLKVTGAARAGFLAGGSDHITFRSCISGDNGVWGIQTAMCDYITVDKCELYGSKEEHGVYFSTTDHPTATDNRIHNNAECGIHMNGDLSEGGDGLITGAVIARNRISRCGSGGGAAINSDGVEKSTFEANVIEECLAGGITSFKGDGKKGGSGNRIVGNVVKFESGKGRYGVQLYGGSTDARLERNIIIIDNGPAVEIDEASTGGFFAAGNLYATPGKAVTFSYQGQEMDFASWQKATGQDADSSLVETPPGR